MHWFGLDESAFSDEECLASEFPVILKLNLSYPCTTARRTVQGAQLSASLSPKMPHKDNSSSLILHLANLFIITMSFLQQKRSPGTSKSHTDGFKVKAEKSNKKH